MFVGRDPIAEYTRSMEEIQRNSMSKTKRIEELIEQAKREQEEPMAKKIHRIEVLEQRVAELMGQVERLQAKVGQLEAERRGWWSIEPYPGPPYIVTSETVVGQSEPMFGTHIKEAKDALKKLMPSTS